MDLVNGKKTYIAAALLLAYQAYTGDFASVAATINTVAGPLLMGIMRWVTSKTSRI